jgi:hypothetical protein
MVTLDDPDGVMSLYRHDFDLDIYSGCVLGEFLAGKLLTRVRNELIGRIQVSIDPILT